MIESISAVTLATADMARAVRFYRLLGFELRYGGKDASFTSFHVGSGYLNLTLQRDRPPGGAGIGTGWGRVILYDPELDALYARIVAAGCHPDTAPADAAWGERYFHITDPDGHQLSFAWPLSPETPSLKEPSR